MVFAKLLVKLLRPETFNLYPNFYFYEYNFENIIEYIK